MYKLIIAFLLGVGVVNAQDGLPVGSVYKKPGKNVNEPVGPLPVGKVFTKSESKILPYGEAYAQAQDSNKPFMIILGAEWCGPCQELKNDVLPSMFKKNMLNDVIVTYVDVDSESDVAQKLYVDKSIPQIIVFTKNGTGWQRKFLVGKQSEEALLALIK